MTADEIKALRGHLGYSQRELAERINCIDPAMRASTTTVSRWETGQRTPSPHAILALTQIAQETVMSTGQRLSTTLRDAARLADDRAAESIADGDPKSAEVSQRLADHLRRLAYNHSAAAQYQSDHGLDPEQLA